MGHQFSILDSLAGLRRPRLAKLLLAACFALSGAAAQAGVLSVTTQQTGGVVTFNVYDSNPFDLCDGGVCFADFAIDYDAAELDFLSSATASPYWAIANAEQGAQGWQVLVSFLADQIDPAHNNLLFSLGFKALVSRQVELTVGTRDLDVPMPYQPLPVEVSVPVVAEVPEPASLLLTTLGLAGLGWARRRRSTQRMRAVSEQSA